MTSVNRYQPPAQKKPSRPGRNISRIPEDAVPPVPPLQLKKAPRRLADAHTARAQGGQGQSTSFEDRMVVKAANRMSQFMQLRMKDIRRLSKNPELSLDHAMAVYGVGGGGSSVVSEEEHSPDRHYSSATSSEENLTYSSKPPRVPASRQNSLDVERVNTRHSPSPTPPSRSSSRQGRDLPPTPSHSKTPSLSSNSGSGRQPGSRGPSMTRAEMHAATFSRKLSVYSSTSGSVSGDSVRTDRPPVPRKDSSHW